MKKIQGVIPPTLTTFDENGYFDPIRMRDFIQFLKPNVSGFFPCGTYGSGPMMDLSERKKVLETVISNSDADHFVIAHIGSSNPAEVLSLAEHARSAGADAVATVIPYYYAVTFNMQNIKAFFQKLVEVANIPVFIYNNPKTIGIPVTLEMLSELKSVGLAGIKDSSFDLLFFYACKYHLDLNEVKYIVGTEAFILPTVPLGAIGTIAGLANAFPEYVMKLYRLTLEKKYDQAFEMQELVNNLREVQHLAQSIPAIHAMLKLRSIDSGFPKFPYSLASDAVLIKMKEALIRLGVEL